MDPGGIQKLARIYWELVSVSEIEGWKWESDSGGDEVDELTPAFRDIAFRLTHDLPIHAKRLCQAKFIVG
jgi:hypothetical protein